MAVVSTPLGFQKPDGNEPMRNVDDIVSDNAQKSDELLTEVRARLAIVDPGGESLGVTDQAMSGVLADSGSQSYTIIGEQISAAQSFVDPADYGVPIDGVTDATGEYQTMLASLPAFSVVEAKAGHKFNITAPLGLSKPVTIRGGEYVANPSGRTFRVSSDNVTLEDFTITGPGAGATYANPGAEARFIDTTGTAASPIKRFHMRRVRMTGSPSSFTWLEWLQDFSITDCYFENFQYAAVMLLSCKRGRVAGNTVRGAVMSAPLVNAYGIAASDAPNTIAARCEDILIEGNYVEGVPQWEGIETHSGRNIQVIGNTVRGCRVGVAIVTGNPDRVVSPEWCTVIGNYIERLTASDTASGIVVAGATSGGSLASATIGHNTVKGYTKDVYIASHNPALTTVAPQTTDAAVLGSPSQGPYRTWSHKGTVNVANGNGTAAITFPVGLFSHPPVVVMGRENASRYTPYATSITKDGCTVGAYDPTLGSGSFIITYMLIATQASPTAATGLNRV